MLRVLADENFNGDIVRGLLRRRPELDVARAQDVGLGNADDPDVLAWAAENDRIVLTHDRRTMPFYAYERMQSGRVMSGIFVLSDRYPIGQAIEELLLMDACSEQEEWRGRVVYLPL